MLLAGGRVLLMKRVLFVCIENANRSQMAEAFAHMYALSHPQVFATIKMGGAAYTLNVPPMETFTNNTPRAKYFGTSGMSLRNATEPRINAAIVIAAGSVISEPNNGTAARANQVVDIAMRNGSRLAMACTTFSTTWSTGLEPATTMIANTNSGSV